jgi:hypothetical protein
MATNFKAKHRKLYFDVTMGGDHLSAAAFVCTQFTNGTKGDRYGNLLDVLPALTGSANNSVKAQSAVSAWFQPNTAGITAAAPWAVDFVGVTATMQSGPLPVVGLGSAVAALHGLPYLTAGTFTPLAQFSGHEAIYGTTALSAGAPRHFAVRMRRRGAATCTVSGTLYVQRQHSIEV